MTTTMAFFCINSLHNWKLDEPVLRGGTAGGGGDHGGGGGPGGESARTPRAELPLPR